jgi:hypothetical protein
VLPVCASFYPLCNSHKRRVARYGLLLLSLLLLVHSCVSGIVIVELWFSADLHTDLHLPVNSVCCRRLVTP